MRKTPYMISLVVVLFTISLTVVSLYLPYWLHTFQPSDVPLARAIDYGLYNRCERRAIPVVFPDPDDPQIPREGVVVEYKCLPFPTRSICERDGQGFCIAWSTAGYLSQLSFVFELAALLALTLANISTKARRRTAWKIVASLVSAHAVLQLICMALVVYLVQHFRSNFAEGIHYSISFWFNVVSWVIDLFLVTGLVITGIYAHKGHRWAAGRRPYHPIIG